MCNLLNPVHAHQQQVSCVAQSNDDVQQNLGDVKFQDAVKSAVETSNSECESRINLLLHSRQKQHEEILKEIQNVRAECISDKAEARAQLEVIEQIRQDIGGLEAQASADREEIGQLLTHAQAHAQDTARSISMM